MISHFFKNSIIVGLICASAAYARESQIQERVNVTTCDIPLDKSAYDLSAKRLRLDVDEAIDQANRNITYVEDSHKRTIGQYQTELQNCREDTNCSRKLANQLKEYDHNYTQQLAQMRAQRRHASQDLTYKFHCLYLRRWVGSLEENVMDIPEVRTLAVGHRFISDPTELTQVLSEETPPWRQAYDGVVKNAVLVRWIFERSGTIHQATILAGINRLATYSDFVSRLDNPPEVTYKDESPILIGSLVYSRTNKNENLRVLTPDIFARTPAAQWVVVPYLLESNRLGRSGD